MRLGWLLRYHRPQQPVRGKASALGAQRVGETGPGPAPEAQKHEQHDPQQQEGAQGPEKDPEEGAEFQTQVLTALAPGRVDGEGLTAGDRERGHGQQGAQPPHPSSLSGQRRFSTTGSAPL